MAHGSTDARRKGWPLLRSHHGQQAGAQPELSAVQEELGIEIFCDHFSHF